MYFVGRFNRTYFDIFANDNPMETVFLKEDITKEDLTKAAQDSDYQIIDVMTRSYFDPKSNKWLKIKSL